MPIIQLRRALILVGFFGLTACVAAPPPSPQPRTAPAAPTAAPSITSPPVAAPGLHLLPARFEDLPGWRDEDFSAALPALRASCARLSQDNNADLARFGFAGSAADWRLPCAALARVQEGAVRQTLIEHFRPWRAYTDLRTGEMRGEGLFTGYFEPVLRGSRTRQGAFQTPLHRRPNDLVTVELGQFRENLRGQRLAGRIERGQLIPYADRAAIAGGALRGKNLEILYVDNPVDAFVLQIQGSGRVRLDDGRELRLGFAAQNGHAYIALGKVLADAGLVNPENITLPAIRAALSARPQEVQDWLNRNPSYVFFEEQPNATGPLGAQGLPLTAGRSLAIDRAHWPLGMPFWVATRIPVESGGDMAFTRLMIGQDTGGAIRGPIRGDIFFGPGRQAEWVAGHMKGQGAKWVLLPRAVDAAARLTIQ